MGETIIRLRQEDVRRIQSLVLEAYWESEKLFDRLKETQMDIPPFLLNAISDKKRILEILEAAMHQQPSSARKEPPVDRGKLLIALECCRSAEVRCQGCRYTLSDCDMTLPEDALAYIGYLEERLEEAGRHGA